MSGWIEEEKERLAKESSDAHQQLEDIRHKKALLVEGAQRIYTEFLSIFKRDIEGFNKIYPAPMEQLSNVEFIGQENTRFTVSRRYPPSYNLDVIFDPQKPSFAYVVSIPDKNNAAPDRKRNEYFFQADTAQNVSMVTSPGHQMNAEDLSKEILLPAFPKK